jgi:hypothetical protein
VNNEQNYALAQGEAGALFNPCAYSTFVWLQEGAKLYYCQSVFDAPSECAAQDAALPNEGDLAAGCGGFPWSELTKQ